MGSLLLMILVFGAWVWILQFLGRKSTSKSYALVPFNFGAALSLPRVLVVLNCMMGRRSG
ncbi:hypothetical protein CC80DRAFT_168791 [Byssothecium circinans]|uniref:Uncharacterized protein n=1 Tax=Byssothecium circinans TaxID=147558 RepID=A0A6A5TMI3_9PLEO|nr:hypothetical protein CC80DRAFT_168791 [Byssothecium circinans]